MNIEKSRWKGNFLKAIFFLNIYKKISLVNLFFFFLATHNIGSGLIVWGRENLHQNCILAHFHDLRNWNEKFHTAFKNIPKTFFARDDNAKQASRLQIETNVNNMPKPAPVHHINHFLTPKFQKWSFHVVIYVVLCQIMTEFYFFSKFKKQVYSTSPKR